MRNIAPGAFKGCDCDSVIIPDSVVSIGEGAFYYCSRLKFAALPARLTKIEDNLFRSCGELRNVNIPNGVTEIGDYAFSGCGNLSMPHLPSGLTKIGGMAFSLGRETNPPWEETLTLPDSLKILESGAFETCHALSSVTIPGGLTEWEYAFFHCANLTSVVISEGVKEIPCAAFHFCKSLKSVSFPSTLIAIRAEAFSETAIERIAIPEGVETIEENAFIIINTSFQVFGHTYPPQKAHYSGESEAGMDFLPLWEVPLKASKIQPQFLFLKRLQIYVQMSEFLNFSLEAFPKNLETGDHQQHPAKSASGICGSISSQKSQIFGIRL